MDCNIRQYLKYGTVVQEGSSKISLEILGFAQTQGVVFLMKTIPYFQVRRVSFADPIYQAGLADDIDRRCSVVRSHSSNSSPVIKSVKTSPTSHSKVSYSLQNMHMSLYINLYLKIRNSLLWIDCFLWRRLRPVSQLYLTGKLIVYPILFLFPKFLQR